MLRDVTGCYGMLRDVTVGFRNQWREPHCMAFLILCRDVKIAWYFQVTPWETFTIITMENHHFIAGKTHYFDWAIFKFANCNSHYQRLPWVSEATIDRSPESSKCQKRYLTSSNSLHTIVLILILHILIYTNYNIYIYRKWYNTFFC